VLDSGATVTVLTGPRFTHFEDVPAGSAMATAAGGGTLQITGGGKAGVFDGVMYSHDLRHSVVSVS
jgi:hypothetical protein